MLRRLVIAFALIVGLSLVCWLVLPRVGFFVPWWVPFVGYGVIVAAMIAQSWESSRDQREQDDFLEDDPGPSRADLERFGKD